MCPSLYCMYLMEPPRSSGGRERSGLISNNKCMYLILFLERRKRRALIEHSIELVFCFVLFFYFYFIFSYRED